MPLSPNSPIESAVAWADSLDAWTLVFACASCWLTYWGLTIMSRRLYQAAEARQGRVPLSVRIPLLAGTLLAGLASVVTLVALGTR